MQRVDSLDYLRGLMASSVMLYHFSGGLDNAYGADHVLGRLGIYAVSIFYVLSGLSLTLVYREGLRSKADVVAYVLKRLFRILPLFWLIVTASVFLRFQVAALTGRPYSPDYWVLFLNYSLLFGFVSPEATPATGAWSIGNEIVFYTLFPFLIWAGRRNKALLALTAVPFLLAYVALAFFVIDPVKPLGGQFSTYVNPLNQAFLFVAGVIIGTCIKPRGTQPLLIACLVLLVLAFCLFPSAGDLISLVTGFQRILFSAICIAFVAVLYASNLRLDNALGSTMKFLGDISYSVYLIHPLILVALQIVAVRAGMALPQTGTRVAVLAIGIPATMLVSYLSYRLLEQPLMRRGAQLAAAVSGAPVSQGLRPPPQ